jgi:hypothetical protein
MMTAAASAATVLELPATSHLMQRWGLCGFRRLLLILVPPVLAATTAARVSDASF